VLYCLKTSISAPTKRDFCDCCRNTGYFRYGVEKAKRFVNVHLHCIVSNMNSISKIPSLLPPWKNFCGRPCSQFIFSLWNCSSPPFHEHEKYDGVFAVFRVWEDETRTVGDALFRGSWLFREQKLKSHFKVTGKRVRTIYLNNGMLLNKTNVLGNWNVSAAQRISVGKASIAYCSCSYLISCPSCTAHVG